MSFLKNLFNSDNKTSINTYADFWNWFQLNEKRFHKVVKSAHNIETDFFDVMAPQLKQLGDGFYFLTGMYDDVTAELILTADGVIENMVFVEELVQAAPVLSGWKFTAFKPASDIDNMLIEMENVKFSNENLFFYSNDLADYPDEIDITIVHTNYNERDKKTFVNGAYIYLDNLVGEWNSVAIIDNVKVIGPTQAQKELVPISKLNDFLIWRQKEFVEKYDGKRYDTEKDNYSLMRAETEAGQEIIVTVNTDLLQWDAKPSHPWIMAVNFNYDGTENNGLPGKEDYQKMDEIEDEIMHHLKDFDGYLNVGRETGCDTRTTYFACKEFKKPSKLMRNMVQKHGQDIEMEFEFFKDKYWTVFDKFTS